MTVEEKIKEQYTELCQLIGSLSLQKEALESQIEDAQLRVKQLLIMSSDLINTEKTSQQSKAEELQKLKTQNEKLAEQLSEVLSKKSEELDAESKCSKCSCNVGPDSD